MTRDLQFEAAVRETAAEVVADYMPRVEQLGLGVVVQLAGWPRDDSDTSELRVKLWRGPTLVDFVEMFVSKDGQRVGSLDDFRQWLVEDLAALLSDAAAEGDRT